ncbi:hypothetical protein SCLCIDRAFT_128703, partial [Scleroderma citrinum Foug A]
PINLFLSSADELFGPITTIHRNSKVVKHIPWSAFAFKVSDWERLNDTRSIIADANNLQQSFSSDTHATLWRVIPALEELKLEHLATIHHRVLYDLYFKFPLIPAEPDYVPLPPPPYSHRNRFRLSHLQRTRPRSAPY